MFIVYMSQISSKLGGLKKHTFIISQFLWISFYGFYGHSLAGFSGSKPHTGCNQGVMSAGVVISFGDSTREDLLPNSLNWLLAGFNPSQTTELKL